ncbi:MAG: serpin family protein [Dehalococcoidia bacterium]
MAKAMDRDVASAYDQFAFRLLQELTAETSGENVFISPTSIAVALSMVYNGAEGETKEAIAEALAVRGITTNALNESNAAWLAQLASDDPKVELALANSIWMREGVPVLEDFLERNRAYYGAQVESLDFSQDAAADTINAWVSQQTNDLISQIVESPIDPRTVMFLMNALYFKGVWMEQFDEGMTRERPFNLLNGSTRDVPMMHRTGEMLYYDADGFEAVSLPYGDGRFTMDILLPEQGEGVSTLARGLDAESWKDLTSRFGEAEVALALPRFTLEYEDELEDALTALGMGIAFSPDQADLSRMLDMQGTGQNGYISSVRHKTFLEVNEEGSEAAAVTSVEVGVTSVGPMPVEFTVDRPFMLAIRDTETETILFIGAVVDPGE